MSKYLKLLPWFLASLFPFAPSQAQFLQGQWRDHLSFHSAHRIAEAGELIYCAAEAGMISYNRVSEEINKHTKVSGLTDVRISTIAFDNSNKKLMIAYLNGNIDLLDEAGAITNIPDIFRKTITGTKSINNIYFHGGMAYLACGFGIVAFDMNRNEIRETYLFGENATPIVVNDVTVINNSIYAATESGIYIASLDSPNLVDFQYWKRLTFIPQQQGEYMQAENHNGILLASYTDDLSLEDKIITIGPDEYSEWPEDYNSIVYDISSTNEHLCISSRDRAQIYDPSGNIIMDFITYGLRQTFVDASNNVFSANEGVGLLWHTGSLSPKYLVVNGPRYNEASKVSTKGNHVWVSSGGPDRLFYHGAAYYFSENRWTSFLQSDMPEKQIIGNTYKFAIDPRDYTHVYAGTHYYGVIEFLNKEAIAVYDHKNTPVFSNIEDRISVRISGLDFDRDNNLWMILDLTPQSLFKLSPGGEWENPSVKSGLLTTGETQYSDLLLTSDNTIWISTLTKGIIVLRDDGSGNFQERSFAVKNQDGNTLSRTYCMREDNEGNIWVGTNAGPIIYYSPGNIFSLNDISGVQFKIPRNDGTGGADYLLGSDVILDIAVDGGNRKWIGTENSGVFLISDDGRETLLNFRQENSKLLSNTVTGIGINEIDGEVFFATGNGLVSYKGTATKGFATYTDVYVYPNPVRPDYNGIITITGLVENSIVKITDLSGNLIWETTSLGGQAIWDGKNFTGGRVASGIYLVMLAVPDGSQSHITKLLFLN
jgi:hypothetical protein